MQFTRIAIPAIFNLVLIVMSTHAEIADSDLTTRSISRIEEYRNALKNLEKSISVYGTVIDEESSGVPDVIIRFGYQYYTPFSPSFSKIKTKEVKTDESGKFCINEIEGRRVYIIDISKRGYEFISDNSAPKGFLDNDLIGDPDDPHIYRMRKLGKPVYLIYKRARFSVSLISSGANSEFDLVEGSVISEKTRGSWVYGPPVCDLTIKSVFDELSKNWIITLIPAGPGAGILLSENDLYMAPEEDYLPEFKFVAQDNKFPEGNLKYIYIRSRSPMIYSKIIIGHFNLGDKEATFSLEIFTNPYGDRNLEPLKDVHGLVEIKLEEEARESLGAGRYPERRDIEQLTRELTRKKPLFGAP